MRCMECDRPSLNPVEFLGEIFGGNFFLTLVYFSSPVGMLYVCCLEGLM